MTDSDSMLEELKALQAQTKPLNQSDVVTAQLRDSDVSRIIEMAWEDRTPFEAIEHQYQLKEADVITLMRQHMHPKSFKLWRKRVTSRATKHQKLRSPEVLRAYCPTQYKHR